MEDKHNTTFNDYANSFDDCFVNYKQNTRLYVAPLVYTNGAFDILSSSPLLWCEETNGFFFQNDRIITKASDPTNNIHNRNLTLVNPTRFYSVYTEDQYEYYYIFFSKIATEALIKYHSYPFTDEIVGALALYVNNKTFIGTSKASITFLITNKPVGEKYMCCALEGYPYNERYNDILKNIGTRYLLMGLIFRLENRFGYTADWAWEDSKIDNEIIQCINEQYNDLDDEYKDLCHFVLPNNYKFVHNTPYSNDLSENIVKKYTNNLYSLIYRNSIAGQLGLIYTHSLEDIEIKLIEKTYKYILGIPQITLSQKDEGQMIRNTVVLYLINIAFSHVHRAQKVSSLWLYRNLFYLRHNTNDKKIFNLANILLQCVLYTNEIDFRSIISNIKEKEIVLKSLKIKTSWKLMEEAFCIHELLFYFNDSVTESIKEDLELSILGRIQNMSNGYDFQTTCEHLKRNVHHTFMGIEEEREFYANEIYSYINEKIKNDPHFGF